MSWGAQTSGEHQMHPYSKSATENVPFGPREENELPRCVCFMFNHWLLMGRSPGFVSFANFCGVNIASVADFKLTT